MSRGAEEAWIEKERLRREAEEAAERARVAAEKARIAAIVSAATAKIEAVVAQAKAKTIDEVRLSVLSSHCRSWLSQTTAAQLRRTQVGPCCFFVRQIALLDWLD